MSPTIKYTLGRIGLFVVCAVLALGLLPRDMDGFLKLLVALVVSMALSYVLLRRWRDEVAERIATGHERRVAEKQRLRSALAGEDDPAEAPSQDSRG